MYSPSECLETVIQDCCHRFNTMQRETGGSPTTYGTYYLFANVYYDDIVHDDYTSNELFYVSHNPYETNGHSHPEGYFYHPNFEIPIREMSSTLNESSPKMFDVVSFTEASSGSIISRTVTDNGFNNDTNLYLYDTVSGEEYKCELLNILDVNVVEFRCDSYSGDLEAGRCRLFAKDASIPSYAEVVPGNTGTYRWRDIIQNGFGDGKQYPFVNGCFYINKDINLFLRRQDPFGEFGLSAHSIYFGLPQITGERNPIEAGTARNTNDAFIEA
jgi:hypothetical protein